MTIDDDYFDVSSFVEDTDAEYPFDRIMTYLSQIEKENEELRAMNSQFKTTIQTMMGIKENKPSVPRSSPYDLSTGTTKELKG